MSDPNTYDPQDDLKRADPLLGIWRNASGHYVHVSANHALPDLYDLVTITPDNAEHWRYALPTRIVHDLATEQAWERGGAPWWKLV